MDSGFFEDDDSALCEWYADDIFSQSGGVRVRADALISSGRKVYKQFMIHERQNQKAFLWRALGLGSVNFVHEGTHTAGTHTQDVTVPWTIRIRLLKGSEHYSDAALKELAAPLGFSSAEDFRHFFRTLTEETEFRDVSIARLRDVAWTVDSLRNVVHNFQQPLYNDMPGAATMHRADSNPDIREAYNDPRFAYSDVVVNYRANYRTLTDERLALLGIRLTRDSTASIPRVTDDLIYALRDIGKSYPFSAEHLKMLIRHELAYISNPFDIDVNVDAFQHIPPENLYAELSKQIDTFLVRSHSGARPTSEAIEALKKLVRHETKVANEHAKYNDPTSLPHPEVQLDVNAPLDASIDAVYQRAVLRRVEFHKLFEPLVVSDARGPSFRLQFGDPTSLFLGENREIQRSQWPRQALRTFFESEIKPTLLHAIRTGVEQVPLRNIVLVDSLIGPHENTLAYVTRRGEVMIVQCGLVSKQGSAKIARVIQHEYQHVNEFAIRDTTTERYRELESFDDPSSLFKETLEAEILQVTQDIEERNRIPDSGFFSRWSKKKELKDLQQYHDQLSATFGDLVGDAQWDWQLTLNADSARGYVSMYARRNAAECVAEQRYAMSVEPIRIALLQRMAHHETSADAARQKTLYDIARDEMKDANPSFYEHTGRDYVSHSDPAQWGLFHGATRKTEHHTVIMALDDSVATTHATETLATSLLKEGYGVAMMEYLPVDDYFRCRLQSNLRDVPVGKPKPTVVLHVVGGSPAEEAADIARYITDTFQRFSPTGRPHTGEHFSFSRIYFEHNYVDPSTHALTRARFLNEFRAEFASEYPNAIIGDRTFDYMWTRPEDLEADMTCYTLG